MAGGNVTMGHMHKFDPPGSPCPRCLGWSWSQNVMENVDSPEFAFPVMLASACERCGFAEMKFPAESRDGREHWFTANGETARRLFEVLFGSRDPDFLRLDFRGHKKE